MRNYIAATKNLSILTLILALFLLNACGGGKDGGGGAPDNGEVLGLQKTTEKSFEDNFGGTYFEKGKAPKDARAIVITGEAYDELTAEVSDDGSKISWKSVETIGLSSSFNALKKINTTFDRAGFKFYSTYKNVTIIGTKIGNSGLRIVRTGTRSNVPNIDMTFIKEGEEEQEESTSDGSNSGWGVVF